MKKYTVWKVAEGKLYRSEIEVDITNLTVEELANYLINVARDLAGTAFTSCDLKDVPHCFINDQTDEPEDGFYLEPLRIELDCVVRRAVGKFTESVILGQDERAALCPSLTAEKLNSDGLTPVK